MSNKKSKSREGNVKKPQKSPYPSPKITYKKIENEGKDKKS